MKRESTQVESGDDGPDPGTVDESLTVNQVVERIPAALAVFSRHGIDTCCGGHLAVAEACERHGIDAGELLARVRRADGAS